MPDETHNEPAIRLGLRPREATTALGVSPRTLWAITADKSSGIPHVRLTPKSVVYPVRELQDWLAKRAMEGAR